jgi:hypothetical protein
MYRTCLYCHGDLGANEGIEQLPIGRRLAFDPAKGRLWVVCRRCERWNLTPFEERWEAIEECERRFRGTKLRYSTDNIGLARLPDGLGLVRIGEPMRPELAAWRYGDQFERRRIRDRLLTAGVVVGVWGAFTVVTGATGFGGFGAVMWGASRKIREYAWTRGKIPTIPGPEGAPVPLTPAQVLAVEIWPQNVGGEWLLAIPNRQHAGQFSAKPSDFRVLSGEDAISAARTLLPILNHAGGNKRAVGEAVSRIESNPDPAHWMNEAIRQPRPEVFGHNGRQLGRQPADLRLALEMLLHEEFERRSLTGEMWLLEREWRRAEEIAGIADNLLLPDGVQERIDTMREG